MKLDLPGLVEERQKSGAVRWRVRVKGDPARRVLIPVGPDDPRFREHYHAARQGRTLAVNSAIPGSIAWLIDLYLPTIADLHPSTIHQRTVFLEWLRAERGEYSLAMPQSELVRLRDRKTPGAADNFIKSVRAMYSWAVMRGHAKVNPAKGIPKVAPGKGARAWSLADLEAYREHHPPGTMPHVALTLFMFTAARIGDVVRLGPGDEIVRGGRTWLSWQPEKRGSARVTIPMLPPLYTATRGARGPTYLLSEWGHPFASKNALGNAFRDWVEDAGLKGLSSHGVRKAAGEFLALNGATQYHIMAVHGHSSPKTSEVYTRGAERDLLAEQAMDKMRGIDW